MKILIFSPYGGKNGAEVMLNALVRAGSKDKDIECFFLFRKRGPLIQDVISNYYIAKVHSNPVLKAVNWLFKAVNIRSIDQWEILRIHRKFRPDFWYINTVHMPEICQLAYKIDQKFIVHYHDLSFQFEKIGYKELQLMSKKAFASVACSGVVANALRNMGANNIRIQYECIPEVPKKYLTIERLQGDSQRGRYVWAMVGNINLRKGVDIFLRISMAFPDDDFLWIGENPTGLKYFYEEFLKANRISNVKFTGFQEEKYFEYLNKIDAFLLTSREDPFPLAMIEAATFGKPIIAFNSGGVSEFVIPGMGEIIEEFSERQIIAAMKRLKNGQIIFDPEISKKRANEFSASRQFKKWKNLLFELNEK